MGPSYTFTSLHFELTIEKGFSGCYFHSPVVFSFHMKSDGHTLVLDIGKTHINIAVLDSHLREIRAAQCSNETLRGEPYDHFDIDAIWDWFCTRCCEFSAEVQINAVNVATHGATAALVNPDAGGNGLVLPVLDYEFVGPDEINHTYHEVRPPFTETCSPALPAGLNLGRQLFWQQKNFLDPFATVAAILMYPQYWAWRLSGVISNEVTSLGCHTDLWQPGGGGFSSLVGKCHWSDIMPPVVSAVKPLGIVKPDVAAATGLPEGCAVYPGVHDSNAGLARFLHANPENKFAVVSTGTWVISMSVGGQVDQLQSAKDMLANVDVMGRPVPCARFMGGREYEAICQSINAEVGAPCDLSQVREILESGTSAFPDFSRGSGPFGGREPEIVGALRNGTALAELYCALMIDYELELLGVNGDVVLEGIMAEDPVLTGVLAALRPGQNIRLLKESSGVSQGCALLARWDQDTPEPVLEKHECPLLSGLIDYRDTWSRYLGQ
jgi:hypothetical protein